MIDRRSARGLTFGLCAALAAMAGPQAAQANSAAMEYFAARAARNPVPALLTQAEREYYTRAFSALDASDWKTVQDLLAQKADGPLHAVLKAEYYLSAGSPKVEAEPLAALLAQAPELPWADRIGQMAVKRGALALPSLPVAQPIATLPTMPRRGRPRSVADGTMPESVSSAINERIKADDPAGARVLLDGIDATLSPAARAEWRQKVGWAFYIENQDETALTLAQSATEGEGPWVAEGLFTAGLAAWRLGRMPQAANAFALAGERADNPELAAAGAFWASRAWMRAKAPQNVAPALRLAARYKDTLYGMMAAEALDLRGPQAAAPVQFTAEDWQKLREVPNVRAAVALAEVGEDALADEVLRHQAKIGDPGHYAPLSRLAREIGLPSTQLWMAYNAPAGARPDDSARFPAPRWTPASGWQVDPALIFAHTLQESVFRAAVVSPAGARGLMQIMPAAAKDHAAALGVSGNAADLSRPTINLAFGQRHLQALSQSAATGGLLPKVIAAYNAGPLPVDRWNSEINAQGDPLLWMESVPYWETRAYVGIVLKNYWMYEKQAGGPSESRAALVQGMWPKFPGLAGGGAVRMAYNGH